MISVGMGSAAVNSDVPVEGARFGDCGLVPRSFESLLAAFPTGAGSLKPRGDIVVLRKVVHHGTEDSVRDYPGIVTSSRSSLKGGIAELDTSEPPTQWKEGTGERESWT